MSKLSILCVLNLIASFTSAALGGIREEDLNARGGVTHAFAMQVTKFVDSSYDSSNPYSGPVTNVKVQASSIPVPANIENTLVLGSPSCFIDANSIKASFNVLGECLLKQDDDKFAYFLSNVFYRPHSNDIVFQIYDSSSSQLLQDFVSTLKAKPAHFITWRLTDRQEKLQLLYQGRPWSTSIYADVLHAQQDGVEGAVFNFTPPRGIGYKAIVESRVAGKMRLTTDGQGNFVAGFEIKEGSASGDGKGAERVILNALLSRMPGDTAANIRTNELVGLILQSFDGVLIRKINNYMGYINKENLSSLTSEQKQEVTKADIAYKDVYSIVFNLISANPFGTLLSIDDVLQKLGDKR